MNEPKININVMPGAQMNGYVKEQNNYFGNVQKITSSEAKENPVVDAEVVTTNKPIHQEAQERNEERFHFVHPEVEDDEAWRIHDAVKRLVAHQRVPEICAYLKELKQKGKVMLPSISAIMYNELVRLGMPTGEGFSEKHFSNSYTK
jgi:FMN phosphatase YigB (HAD superfamily)